MKTPPRSVRVPVTLWHQARTVAAQRGDSVSAVVVRALQRYVARYSTFGAIASPLGEDQTRVIVQTRESDPGDTGAGVAATSQGSGPAD